MKHLLPAAVLLLMLSIGMSLDRERLVAIWRRLTVSAWFRLLLATFLVPPALALALGKLLPLGPAATAGLFLVGVSPGAPLMTRGLAKKGHDLQLAAAYQIWAALMVPVMIPLLVFAGGWLHGRDLWIPPRELLAVIATQQLAPLAAGAILSHFLPSLAGRLRSPLALIGNILLAIVIAALLIKLGPVLTGTSPWIFIAAALLASGCLAATLLLLGWRKPDSPTFALGNVNRHVGLALLVSGQLLHIPRALPAIAAYALAAVLVMTLWTKLAPRGRPAS
jgi:BASS family bile acid:Na+ symporter